MAKKKKAKKKKAKKKQIEDLSQYILAALVAAGPGAIFNHSHIQRILFIINEEMAKEIGGSFFNFKSGVFGPGDQGIYDKIHELAKEDYLEVFITDRIERIVLNQNGFKTGEAVLNGLTPRLRDYFKKVASWAVKCSFTEIVSAVFNSYPETRTERLFS